MLAVEDLRWREGGVRVRRPLSELGGGLCRESAINQSLVGGCRTLVLTEFRSEGWWGIVRDGVPPLVLPRRFPILTNRSYTAD